jgi:hypothetical protein
MSSITIQFSQYASTLTAMSSKNLSAHPFPRGLLLSNLIKWPHFLIPITSLVLLHLTRQYTFLAEDHLIKAKAWYCEALLTAIDPGYHPPPYTPTEARAVEGSPLPPCTNLLEESSRTYVCEPSTNTYIQVPVFRLLHLSWSWPPWNPYQIDAYLRCGDELYSNQPPWWYALDVPYTSPDRRPVLWMFPEVYAQARWLRGSLGIVIVVVGFVLLLLGTCRTDMPVLATRRSQMYLICFVGGCILPLVFSWMLLSADLKNETEFWRRRIEEVPLSEAWPRPWIPY